MTERPQSKAMGMIKVWGRNTSLNVQKVLWTLDELGLDYERVDIGGAFGGLDTPEFGRLNPNRKIPVIEDGDFVLWESDAIVRYLIDAYGLGALSTSDVKVRAIANQWSAWCKSTVYPDFISGTFQPLIRVPAAERDTAAVDAAAERTGSALKILDAALTGHRFIVGDTMTFADIEIGALFHRYFTLPIARPELPNIMAYHERLKSRPGYQAHVMQDWSVMKVPGA
jgi:glutathione S-transferase